MIAGLRLAFSNAASRIAIPLLVVGMALVFVQPCAALSFQFEETGSMAEARDVGTAVLLQNGRVLVAGGILTSGPSRERGTLRSGYRDLDDDRQPCRGTRVSHDDVASQWQGARGGR